jgi:hypothetical protein
MSIRLVQPIVILVTLPLTLTVCGGCVAQARAAGAAAAVESAEQAFLVVDAARALTCTVLDRSLALHNDPAFAPFQPTPCANAQPPACPEVRHSPSATTTLSHEDSHSIPFHL